MTRRLSHRHCFFLCLILCLNSLLQCSTSCYGKEIEATKEWTKLGENDTVAAGMHVRMDLSTGEKWVKTIDEDEKQGDRISSQVTADGMVVAQVDAEGTVESSVQEKSTAEANYDFDMMHRTLSNLPPDEQERMGGIPELPGQVSSTVTPEQRKFFEERMKKIWEQRQAELKEFQENHMVNIPEILKDRIQSLRDYLKDPVATLNELDLETHEDDKVGDILGVLKDLEYQLTDVDMTRDFHTLGGWPLLASFLADSVHENYQNDTQKLSEDDWNKVNLLQAYAAWTIGTAVKNLGEFAPFAIDEVEVLQQGDTVKTTPLDLVVAQFVASSKAVLDDSRNKDDYYDTVMLKVHKTLYALGSLLRGNRNSQNHFCADQGPALLSNVLAELAERQSPMPRDTTKVAQRLLTLAQDIVMDVTTHASMSSQVDEAIRNAFSTPQWCSTIVQFIGVPRLYETSLTAIQQLASHCKAEWDLEFVQRQIKAPPSQVREAWLPDDLDHDIRKERIVLLESTVQAIESVKD